MFSFFKKNTPADFSFLGADMHSHLLPALDDGLQNPEQTLHFMKELTGLGYRKFICTPHILSGVHPNTPATILPALDDIKNLLHENNINITVEAAAEYMVDYEFATLVKSNEQLLTFGSNYVLIEMSYMAASNYLEQVIFDLKLKGFQPILAHPERYSYWHKNFNQFIDVRDRGCLLQMNLLSLSGYYDKDIRKIAKKLLEEDMISFVGTDTHHYNHLNAIQSFANDSKMYELLKSKDFLNETLL